MVHTVVFVSLGGDLFLAFLIVVLFCLAKKRIATCVPRSVRAEREHVRETITKTTSPCGEQNMTVVKINDDVELHQEPISSSRTSDYRTFHI
ncbi:hypothetical protein L484_026062 [Morus notabilis]|uniref:Uncharacterized protein n=1 Tax=Morus notabilis TaxID=981085 RepID=W9RWP3_9ROSA|nr:hypothetical protein L484_026062 [Morus notabilis]